MGVYASMEPALHAVLPRRPTTPRLLEPVDFIRVTEETGLIVPLGDLVLRKACRDVAG